MLYTLVTDRVFLREPSIVWESIVDVDGESSSFYDSFMVGSTPAGGDFAGHTAEQIARMYDQRHNDAAMSVEYVRYPYATGILNSFTAPNLHDSCSLRRTLVHGRNVIEWSYNNVNWKPGKTRGETHERQPRRNDPLLRRIRRRIKGIALSCRGDATQITCM
jgi:hypothetical protein